MAVAMSAHRPTWRMVDRFLPVSAYTAEHLIRTGIAREKVVVTPNSVTDPGPVKPLGDGLLFAARLAPGKGVGFAIDAWERSGLAATTRLVIAGDGEDRGIVEAAAMRVRGIEYVGLVDQQRIGELLDECAVAIIPSLWAEPFGRFAIEAFAHGRSVVATDVGGLAELVDDETGRRVTPSVEAFADAMVAALSPGEAVRKGLAARIRFETRYTNDRVLDVLLQTYNSLRRA